MKRIRERLRARTAEASDQLSMIDAGLGSAKDSRAARLGKAAMMAGIVLEANEPVVNVFVVTLCGFVLPFVLNIKLYGVPAPMFTGVSALALSVAFFNFIRIGRRPLWFQHTCRALLVSSRERAALPVDGLNEAWLEDTGG